MTKTFSDAPHPPIETLIASVEASDAISAHILLERELIKVKHGHNFGKNHTCECGITEINYQMLNKNPCPLVKIRYYARAEYKPK